MQIRLKARARIWHEAGEVVNASPADAEFLVAVGTAEIVEPEAPETPEKQKRVTTRKKG